MSQNKSKMGKLQYITVRTLNKKFKELQKKTHLMTILRNYKQEGHDVPGSLTWAKIRHESDGINHMRGAS